MENYTDEELETLKLLLEKGGLNLSPAIDVPCAVES
jgi:hypothetical protein